MTTGDLSGVLRILRSSRRWWSRSSCPGSLSSLLLGRGSGVGRSRRKEQEVGDKSKKQEVGAP